MEVTIMEKTGTVWKGRASKILLKNNMRTQNNFDALVSRNL